MANVDWSHWAVVIFFFGLMCVYAFLLARIAFQVVLRLSKKINRSLYRKWGVEEDLLWPHPRAWFIGWGIGVALGALFTFVIALFSTLLITEPSRVGGDQIYDTFSFFFMGFILGAAVEWRRFEDLQRKVKRLDGLRDVFHNRFKVSELLSVYESLQHSPPLFWEEYTDLPDEEVNEETNRKYRELAAPYRYNQSSRHNRITIVVGALTLVVAVLGAIFAAREFFS